MVKTNMNYFPVSNAVSIHDWIIENTGGLKGVKDVGMLESALTHIQNDLYYPEFEDKLTHLVFSTIQFHPFNDGNKRSSVLLGALFLVINDFEYVTKKFVMEMENIVVWVAEGKISKELLKDVIASIIYETEYSEELRLRLMVSIR